MRDEAERTRLVAGKRANNYGVCSNVRHGHSRRMDMLALQTVRELVAKDGEVKLCRCYRSSTFPLCDGSHNAHNAESCDNAGPLVIKATAAPAPSPVLQVHKPSGGGMLGSFWSRGKAPASSRCQGMCADSTDCASKGIDAAATAANGGVVTNGVALPAASRAAAGMAAPKAGSVPADARVRLLSADEVARHNSAADCWLVIHGRVYDVTAFLAEHPGGANLLLQYAGGIADEGFDGNHTEAVLAQNLPPPLGSLVPVASQLAGRGEDGSAPPVPAGTSGASSTSASVVHESVLARCFGRLAAVCLQGPAGGARAAAPPGAPPAAPPSIKPPIEWCLNLYDFHAVARLTLKPSSYAYYATGATDELTKCGNQDIYRRIRLRPRVMVDVSDVRLDTSMLGVGVRMPIYISAAAKGGLAHPDAELALARAAHSCGVVQMCPHLGTQPLEAMAGARDPAQTQFLQLYMEKDRAKAAATLRTAAQLGFAAVFITVDSAGIGKRESDWRAAAP